MKFLFTADLHIHPYREYSTNNGVDRLQDGLSILEQLCQLAGHHQCPLVIGGDLKALKDKWYDAVLNGYLDCFSRHHDIPIYIIPGNHDGVKGEPSGLEAFRHTQNVVIFTKPVVTSNGFGKPILFYPWSPDWHDLPNMVTEAKQAKAEVIISHAFIEGAKVGASDFRPKRGASLASFGLEHNRVFPWGFFGDIHKQQCLIQRFQTDRKGKPFVTGEVWYAGSPYAQRKDEIETDKGALLVDMNAPRVVTPIPLKAPQFLRFDLTVTTDLNAQKLAKQKGNFVDVIAPHNVDPLILERLRKVLEPRTFYVHTQPPKKATAKRAEVHAGMSNTELVKNYLKAKTLPDGVPVTMLEKAGIMLMSE